MSIAPQATIVLISSEKLKPLGPETYFSDGDIPFHSSELVNRCSTNSPYDSNGVAFF
jgi:hypothetical protein